MAVNRPALKATDLYVSGSGGGLCIGGTSGSKYVQVGGSILHLVKNVRRFHC